MSELVRKQSGILIRKLVIDPRAAVKDAQRNGPIFTMVEYEDVLKFCEGCVDLHIRHLNEGNHR